MAKTAEQIAAEEADKKKADKKDGATAAKPKGTGPGSIVHIVTAHGDHLNAKIVKLDKTGKLAELRCYLPGDKKKRPSTIKESPLDLTALTPDSWHPIEEESDEADDDLDAIDDAE